jgi:molybdopterin-synthase adenylyltransferase
VVVPVETAVDIVSDADIPTRRVGVTSQNVDDPFFNSVHASGLLRRILRDKVIAVVGLSGGGSQVIPHLAALGVGEIIGIDDQRTDDSNRFATPNLGWIDASAGSRKTTSARVRASLVNRHVKFTRINARVPEPKAVEALKRSDVIVGSVNNLHARADLNEIAWRYCIPYVDIGLVLSVDEQSSAEIKPLSGISGNIFTALPGGPCLRCTGFVSKEKLDLETGGRGRSYLRTADGANVFVAPFNGTLASEAAAEVLRLLVGIRRGTEFRKIYDGFSGTLLECVVRKRHDCEVCGRSLALGDPIWD